MHSGRGRSASGERARTAGVNGLLVLDLPPAWRRAFPAAYEALGGAGPGVVDLALAAACAAVALLLGAATFGEHLSGWDVGIALLRWYRASQEQIVRTTKVPLADVRDNPENLKLLDKWLNRFEIPDSWGKGDQQN